MALRRDRLRPMEPILKNRPRQGSIVVGDTPGTAPFGLTLEGSVTDGTNLNNPYGIAVNATHAFVTTLQNDTLTSIDITDPTTPTVDHAFTDHTNLDWCTDVIVDGDYAYVLSDPTGSGNGRLTVVDISDPSSMSVAGSVSISDPAGLAKDGDYCYVGSSASNNIFRIVDVSTPASPAVVSGGTITDSNYFNNVLGIAVNGNYAYVTSQWSNGLTVVDVTTKSSPSVSGSVTSVPGDIPIGSLFGCVYTSGYAITTSDGDDAVASWDVSTPASPTYETFYSSSTYLNTPLALVLVGSHVLVAADEYVSAIDVSDPTTLAAPAVFVTDVDLANAWKIAHSGSIVVVACAAVNRIAVLSISGTP